eukprot:3102771-Rhodomonas_salina.1
MTWFNSCSKLQGSGHFAMQGRLQKQYTPPQARAATAGVSQRAQGAHTDREEEVCEGGRLPLAHPDCQCSRRAARFDRKIVNYHYGCFPGNPKPGGER